MTIPNEFNLPIRPLGDNPKELENYITDLSNTLEDALTTLADGINGQFKTDTLSQKEQYIPTLDGSTSGNFTYVHQNGWVLRKGLLVDLWFDIQWSATTASGNLFLNLPYEVAMTANLPFVGFVQPSNVAFTVGTDIVINALTETYRGYFYNTGNGIPTANQLVVASGRLIGYIRYIGKQNE